MCQNNVSKFVSRGVLIPTPILPSERLHGSAEFYNAAADLLGRNLVAGRGEKIAFIDEAGKFTFSEMAERAARVANVLRNWGLEPGQRIVLCLLDTIDFPTSFLGAIRSGIVPIPVNTLWTASDYAFMLSDSGAQAAIVSESRLPVFLEAAQLANWSGRVIVSGNAYGGNLPWLLQLLKFASSHSETHRTRTDDECFWLYSSGSTGKPKAAVHVQTSMAYTAQLFAQNVLGINEHDVIFSAAKLFFAYGLGNALSFPLALGATSVLFDGRPTPASVCGILREKRPTIFCGVPTLFSSLLACGDLPHPGEHSLRLCMSAGEALPEEVGRAWREQTGVDIIDGIGSTEMLHIFISNRPGEVRYGTTGFPVPGYRVRLVDENNQEVAGGEIGNLQVSGPTRAAHYWNNPEKTRETFLGEWLKTGDRFRQGLGGEFIYCGRSDDMLKVSGLWVSPVEVESALMSHPAVLEAAVVGLPDENDLIKPKAFVVVKPGAAASPQLAEELQNFVKSKLAPYKYPRWIEFLDELPKTATGKVQRYLLRKSTEKADSRHGGQASIRLPAQAGSE
jgi:benzoate-CoA ligase